MTVYRVFYICGFCLTGLIVLLVGNNCSEPSGYTAVVNRIHIVPKPNKMVFRDGRFILSRSTKIRTVKNCKDTQKLAEYLHDQFVQRVNIKLKRKNIKENRTVTNAILIRLDSTLEKLGPEGYRLTVSPENITIRALKPPGLFYGIQSFLQMLPDDTLSPVRRIQFPSVTIEDKPRFSWRGMHLDVCRHFFPVSFIKKYIDLIALHKMNRFHWHLTEDQGWRIEIKKYPKLTEIGAWRVDRENQPWNKRTPPGDGEKATYGGFYTQDEIRDVVQYAQDRFVTIVPEIEMPGHATAALASYPELACTKGPFYVMPGGYWPGQNIFCAGKDSTFIFLEGVLEEVAGLFPGPWIHIGGDEAFKKNWRKCPDCRERIKKEHLKNVDELQSYFIKRIEKFLISRNKKLIGWDEILEGGLAPEATVMSWRGMEGGIAAANEGHDVIMAPTSYCYFDYYQARKGEPPAFNGFIPLEKVYRFEPIPAVLSNDKRHFILGAQGNCWTEFMPNGRHVQYMVLPRMCALAEVLWSNKKQRDWDDFLVRLKTHLKRLDALGVNYRKLDQ